MKKFLLTIFLGTILLATIQAQETLPEYLQDLPPGRYAVGFTVRHCYDYSRTFKEKQNYLGEKTEAEIARPIQICIWYPGELRKQQKPMQLLDYLLLKATELDFSAADDDRQHAALQIFQSYMKRHIGNNYSEELWEKTKNKKMLAYKDAAFLSARFPLILYAPGAPGEAYENYRLCEYLASYGYVVASIPTTGDHAKGVQLSMVGIETQARDLEFALAFMRNFPDVDHTRTATIGFSWGGISNVLFALRNRKVDALVSLDGAITSKKYLNIFKNSPYFDLRKFQTPAMIIVGQTKTSKPDTEFYDALKYAPAYLVNAPELPHSQFRSLANILHIYHRNDLGHDYIKTIDISYMAVCRVILNFLQAYLKNDAAGMAYLQATPEMYNLPGGLLTINRKKAEARPPMDEELFDMARTQGIDTAIRMFQQTRTTDPEVILFDENLMNRFAYEYLQAGKSQEAISLFKLNAETYPQSSNVFDSLGEAYLSVGDTSAALQNYHKALELDPGSINAREAIEKIRKEKN